MIGVYFSGTGNTKHCIERFLNGLDSGAQICSLENPQAAEAVKVADEIVFAYPVYYSNLPKIADGKAKFNGKCTMCYRCFSNCPKQAIEDLRPRLFRR